MKTVAYSIDIVRKEDGFVVFHCEYEPSEYKKAESDYNFIVEDFKKNNDILYSVELNELLTEGIPNRYYVCGQSGTPFGGQPADGYTLSEAYDRIDREVKELTRLGYDVSAEDFSVVRFEHVY